MKQILTAITLSLLLLGICNTAITASNQQPNNSLVTMENFPNSKQINPPKPTLEGCGFVFRGNKMVTSKSKNELAEAD